MRRIVYIVFIFLFPVFLWAQFPSTKDCNTAYRICDVTQNYYFVADTNPGAIDDSYLVDIGGGFFTRKIYCIAGNTYPTGEWHPAWFKFTAQYSGEFGFLICPDNPTTDWQWALFENPVCGDLSDTSHQFTCSAAQPEIQVQGCQGIGFKNGFGGGLVAY